MPLITEAASVTLRALRAGATRLLAGGAKATPEVIELVAKPTLGKRLLRWGVEGLIGAAAYEVVDHVFSDRVSRDDVKRILREAGATNQSRLEDLSPSAQKEIATALGEPLALAIRERDDFIIAVRDAIRRLGGQWSTSQAGVLTTVADICTITVADAEILHAAIGYQSGAEYAADTHVRSAIYRITAAKILAAVPDSLDAAPTGSPPGSAPAPASAPPPAPIPTGTPNTPGTTP